MVESPVLLCSLEKSHPVQFHLWRGSSSLLIPSSPDHGPRPLLLWSFMLFTISSLASEHMVGLYFLASLGVRCDLEFAVLNKV